MTDQQIEEQLKICEAYQWAVDPAHKPTCQEAAAEMQVRVDEFRFAARMGYPEALRELKESRAELIDVCKANFLCAVERGEDK